MPARPANNSTSSINRLYTDQEWLRTASATKSINQIAQECGVAGSTIRKYMKRYDIRRRSISEASKLRYEDPEYKHKRRQQWDSNEYRERQRQIADQNKELKSQISSELWETDDFSRKCKRAHAEAMKSDETRQHISSGIKKKWCDKEYQRKQKELSATKSRQLSQVMRELWSQQDYRSTKLASNKTQGEKRRLSTIKFIERARELHGSNFDYSNTDYVTYDRHKIDIICNHCGHLFQQLPGNHIKGCKCPHCHISQGQREIYDFVTKFHHAILNDRSLISPYELDIVVPDHKLAIEFHGLRWHSYNRPESVSERLRHQAKALQCAESDITLLQFFDFQWAEHRRIVESMLLHKFGLSRRYYARDLQIGDISTSVADSFFSTNHLYGSRSARHNFGLFDNDDLLMAVSLSGGQEPEIIRLATSAGCVVVGGLSKLISFVMKSLQPRLIKTFADLCFSNAIGYSAAGFRCSGLTKPGYFYYRGGVRLSRQQCQKHKLPQLLRGGFNEDLSEPINMFLNGYRRVWDAGNLKLRLES